MEQKLFKLVNGAIETSKDFPFEVLSKEGDCIKMRNEFYAYYEDRMSDKEAAEILLSDCPDGLYNEKMLDWYYEAYYDDMRRAINIIKSYVRGNAPARSKYRRGLLIEEQEEIREYLEDNTEFIYPFEHYDKQEFNCEIVIRIGTETPVVNYMNFLSTREENYSSVLWLAQQQGYSPKDLIAACNNDTQSVLLKSIVSELSNTSSECNVLTILARLTFDELMEIRYLQDDYKETLKRTGNAEYATVTIGKEAVAGLIDMIYGGGGSADIQFEKDLVIPVKNIEYALPDCGFKKTYGYSPDEIYGFAPCAYTRCLKNISQPQPNLEKI